MVVQAERRFLRERSNSRKLALGPGSVSISNSHIQLDTALTDYLLCIEALIFVALLRRTPLANRAKRMSELLFATLAAASLLGGLSHSLLTDDRSPLYQAVWTMTMIAIGGIGWSAWNLGASLLAIRWQLPALVASSGALAAYSVVVLFFSQRYLIAIGHYLLGVTFLLGALAWMLRSKVPGAHTAFIGVLLSVLAPAPHILDYSPAPELLSPNAVYHLLQAFALVLIYSGIRTLLPRYELRTALQEIPAMP